MCEVGPSPVCSPEKLSPSFASVSTAGCGPVGPLTTTFHLPSSGTGAEASGAAATGLTGALAFAGFLPTQTGSESQPRTVDGSEEHTSELQSLMRISYAVFCLKKKKK